MSSMDKLAKPAVVNGSSQLRELKLQVADDTLVMISMTHAELVRIWKYVDEIYLSRARDRAKYLKKKGGEYTRGEYTHQPINMTIHALVKKPQA